MITVHESGKPLSTSDVQEMGRLLGLTLPGDYVEFVTRHNGAWFEGGRYIFEMLRFGGNIEECMLNVLYGFRSGIGIGDVVDKTMLFRNARRISSRMVCIGNDGTRVEYMLICEKGSDFGKVVAWDKDEEIPGEIDSGVEFVAESFGAFLQMLYFEKC